MAFDANDLSPHEHHVVERTREGEVADFTALAGPDGAKPVVRAGFLRKLLLRLDAAWPVQAPGVRIRGARIEGDLDLSDCAGGSGLPALALEGCDIPGTIDVSYTRLARLSIEGSRLRRLMANEAVVDGEFCFERATPLGENGDTSLFLRMRAARIGGDVRGNGAKLARAVGGSEFGSAVNAVLFLQGARIGGNLMLSDDFSANGCVWLLGAEIGCAINLSHAHLLNTDDNETENTALLGANVRVAGSIFLSKSFKADGKIDLFAASIGGDVDADDGVFKNEGAVALRLSNAEIHGDLRAAAKITGEVALHNAQLHRALYFVGVEITPSTRGEPQGFAIAAPGLRVAGSMMLDGANIKGELILADARIDGNLSFGGGRYINGGGCAIRATNARVGGNLTFKIEDEGYAPFGQKSVIEGSTTFERARIDGTMVWRNLEIRGKGRNSAGPIFSFADATIAGPLEAHALTTQADACIDASGASCAALDDDVKTGWGAENAQLSLEGFAYGRIDSQNETWTKRLAWLKRARGADRRYSPQPFAHAAVVYARAGKRESARRILLAQHDLRAVSRAPGPVTWTLSSLFGLIAGYGLAPIRVIRALVLFLALGVFGVLVMNAQGALVTPDGRACNGAVEPALYAIDVALPVLDLGQQSQCAPGRTARAELAPGTPISETSDWRLFEGLAMWRWAHALYAMLGAILAALAVLTFSGVMKPRES